MVTINFGAHTQEWIDAWNSHDLNRIMAHYCDDVELVSPIVIKLTGRSDATVCAKRHCEIISRLDCRRIRVSGLISFVSTPASAVAWWSTGASMACSRRN